MWHACDPRTQQAETRGFSAHSQCRHGVWELSSKKMGGGGGNTYIFIHNMYSLELIIKNYCYCKMLNNIKYSFIYQTGMIGEIHIWYSVCVCVCIHICLSNELQNVESTFIWVTDIYLKMLTALASMKPKYLKTPLRACQWAENEGNTPYPHSEGRVRAPTQE